MKSLLKTIILLPGVLLADTAPELEADADASSPWKLRAGVMLRNMGGTKFSPNAGATQGLAAGIGDAAAYDDRIYDDGFVSQGAATAGTGSTTFFGYDSLSQVSGGNLIYTATGGAAVSAPGAVKDDDDTEAAPYVALSYTLLTREDLEVGLSIGFSATSLDSRAQSTVSEFSVTTTDTYDLMGVALLGSPYSGTFTGPGPLIDNIPTSRDNVSTLAATHAYEFSTDTDVYSLILGGDLEWTVSDRIYLRAAGGLLVNFTDWSAKSTSYSVAGGTTDVVETRESSSDTDVLWGVYGELGVGVQLSEQWAVEGFVRYDWSEDLEESVGSTDFETDLSGESFGLGLVYSF